MSFGNIFRSHEVQSCESSKAIIVIKRLESFTMKYPALFVNHGGGSLPLLGRQPDIAQHIMEVTAKWLDYRKRNPA
jgi:hypothetical protein